MSHIDQQKYLQILKDRGVEPALTALHRDLNLLEIEAFEGPGGYDPDLLRQIDELRVFSRDLWKSALNQGSSSSG